MRKEWPIKGGAFAVAFVCENKKCCFKVFFTRHEEKTYHLEKPKSELRHNHELKDGKKFSRYSSKADLSECMMEYISNMAPTLKRKSDLSKVLNSEFGSNFHKNQSYYLLIKQKESRYGLRTEDAKNLIEDLQARENIFFDYMLDSESHLSHFIYSSPEMLNRLRIYSDVLIFDVTHQISRYELNMPLLVGLNNEGRTVIFFYGLLHSQDLDSLDWFFGRIKDVMAKLKIQEPKVVFSDDGTSVTPNIAKHFCNSENLICSWHASQNFSRNIKNKEFRKAAKYLPFSKDLEEVNEIITQIKSKDYPEEDLQYFAKKIDSIELWSSAFHREHLTLGIDTTSRVESLNGVFKKQLEKTTSLRELQEYVEHKFIDPLPKAGPNNLKNKKFYVYPLKMEVLAAYCSKYATQILEDLYFSAIFGHQVYPGLTNKSWKVTPRKTTDSFVVKKLKGILDCNCSKNYHLGLPCIHVLAVWDSLDSEDLDCLYILERWKNNCEDGKEPINLKSICCFKTTQILNPVHGTRPGRKKKANRFLSKTDIITKKIKKSRSRSTTIKTN